MSADEEFQELFGEWGMDSEEQPLALSVETYKGTGANGAVYKQPVSLPGLPQFPQDRLVRMSTGDEKISSTAVYAPLSKAEHFTLGSRVTLHSGRVAAILGLGMPDTFGLFGFVVVNLE